MTPAELTYTRAIQELEGALRFGINPSLDGIRTLTARLAEPQDAYRCVQVTGTNGKTSVTRLLSAILHAHGLRVGTYTSPHLVSYTERVEIDGVPITEECFARSVSAVLEASGDMRDSAVTEFELLTAAALDAFRHHQVTWACLEVGMGGRWDATSVVAPRVSVVTGVALDHTDRLGMTREEIAGDKAYIIKPGAVAVIGPGCTGVESILRDRARAVGAPMVRVGSINGDVTWRVLSVPCAPGGMTRLIVDGAFTVYDDLEVRAPSYQAPNVAVAIAAAEAALGQPLDSDALSETLATMVFPGRFELLGEAPPLLIDGAHNPEAATVLAGAVREAFGSKKPIIVLGVMADKDAEGIVRALAPVAGGFVCTQSHSPRALDAEALADIVRSCGAVVLGTERSVASAVAHARLMLAPGVVCAGSIYVAGEVRALFNPVP
ncbi:MAG: folylpolyglutamate synthase/dihydrofolate synthase family protein [Actinomycetota bacterium]|nr:folylpolyglutamate synthase/dihydrofolate synthase family protein [Actinomycetota bacterium]